MTGYPFCEAPVHRGILLINRNDENPTDSSTEFSTNPFTKRASYDKNLRANCGTGRESPSFGQSSKTHCGATRSASTVARCARVDPQFHRRGRRRPDDVR